MRTPRPRYHVIMTVLACVGYASAIALGRSTRIEGSETALIWPAAAVAVIWFLLFRSREMTLVTAVALSLTTAVMNHLTGADWALSAAFGAINLVLGLTIASGLRWGGHEPRLDTPRDMMRLVVAIAIGSTTAAVLAAMTLSARGVPWFDAFVAFNTRNGVTTFLGVAIYLRVTGRAGGLRAWASEVLNSDVAVLRVLELLLGLSAAALLFVAVFVTNDTSPYAYLMIAASVVVGLRLSTTGGLVYTFVLASAVLVGTLDGSWGLTDSDPADRALRAQGLVGCALLVTLTIALYRDSRSQLIGELNARNAATQASADELRSIALYDHLTGLANRVLLHERLAQAIAVSHRTASTVGVLFLDLNGFKQINDSWGHERGDEVLVQVAERLTALARPGDTVARLGGDEFVVVCPDLRDTDELAPIAARYAESLSRPILLADCDQIDGVSASIGTACSGIDSTPTSILRSADHTMYEAKRRRARTGDGRAD